MLHVQDRHNYFVQIILLNNSTDDKRILKQTEECSSSQKSFSPFFTFSSWVQFLIIYIYKILRYVSVQGSAVSGL
jgi:hypothetical protein